MAKNYIGISDAGRMRNNNEDSFIAEPVMSNRMIAACVIDGVGGYAGGEVAAAIARDTILEHLQSGTGEPIRQLKQAIVAASNKIQEEKRNGNDNGKMACVLTLALVDIDNNKFYYGHVGDTRLYLLRDGSLVKVTKDHSFVGFLEDSGRLTEEAAMRHPKRNEINKALGFDGELSEDGDYIETGESPFLPGDMLLLCSDGLTDLVSNKQMTAIVTDRKSLEDKARSLINAANDAGGKDNITVVLVDNNKKPTQYEATKPIGAAKTTAISKAENDAVNLSVPKTEETQKKSSSGTVSLLAILLILVTAALAWVLYREYVRERDAASELQNKQLPKERNEQELQLINNINNTTTGEAFVLNQAGGAPITITDSIVINHDSLHIIGNGVILVSDTAYKGPAFFVSHHNKYLLLDSVTLENFDIGVLVQTQGLQLKNVQFRNCRIPVQYNVLFPSNTAINGMLTTPFYNINDTIQNNIQ